MNFFFGQYKFFKYGLANNTPDFLSFEEAKALENIYRGKFEDCDKNIIDKLISYGHVKIVDGTYVPNILIVKDSTFNIISNSNLQLIKEIYDLLETVPSIERGYILDQALEAGWLHYDENTPKNVGAFIRF